MERIVFLDRASLPAALPCPRFPHTWVDHEHTSEAQIIERIRNATIVITNKVKLREDTLAQAPSLKLICVAATGTDNVDLAYCRDHGIRVNNVTEYGTTSVAEHTMALLLSLRRSVHAYSQSVSDGDWQKSPVFCLHRWAIQDLHDSVIAIIGGGHIGRAVGQLAQAFGMEVLYVERRGARTVRQGYVSFQQGIEMADVISLHLPLTPETHHLIDSRTLLGMKPSSLLINTARGALVDSYALLDALKNGRLAGAALDVLDEEPPGKHHPLTCAALPNLLVTPHIAWASTQAMERLGNSMIKNMELAVGIP